MCHKCKRKACHSRTAVTMLQGQESTVRQDEDCHAGRVYITSDWSAEIGLHPYGHSDHLFSCPLGSLLWSDAAPLVFKAFKTLLFLRKPWMHFFCTILITMQSIEIE